jgi:hypothetical protein
MSCSFPDENTVRVSAANVGGSAVPKRDFELDRVFGPHVDQAELFEEVQPIVQSVFDGYNACVLAYGQTGAGKTYTMVRLPVSHSASARRRLLRWFGSSDYVQASQKALFLPRKAKRSKKKEALENTRVLHATGLMIMGLRLSWFEIRKRVLLKRWCASASSAMRKPEPLQSLHVRRLVSQSDWFRERNRSRGIAVCLRGGVRKSGPDFGQLVDELPLNDGPSGPHFNL